MLIFHNENLQAWLRQFLAGSAERVGLVSKRRKGVDEREREPPMTQGERPEGKSTDEIMFVSRKGST